MQDTPPFFSIVTIVRNDAIGLERTARSVLEQKFSDFEWMVIDGASTDETARVAERHRAHMATFVSEPDRGIYDAMNKGLRRARGEYLIFMNAGDSFAAKNVLAQAHKELTRQPADLLFGSSMMNFGAVSVHRPVRKPGYIWHGQPGMHQATFFKRSQHLKFEYDTAYRICGDYDAITRMFAAGLTLRSAPLLVNINDFNPNSTSGRKKLLLLREAATIQRRNLKHSLAKTLVSLALRAVTSLVSKLLSRMPAR